MSERTYWRQRVHAVRSARTLLPLLMELFENILPTARTNPCVFKEHKWWGESTKLMELYFGAKPDSQAVASKSCVVE